MFQPGDLVGNKYRLERLIGKGAFASVWAATNVMIEREVALKILDETPASKPTIVARFLKEAKLCATPIHPTIVAVKDLGQTEEGIPFLVMELLEGHSLHQVLKSRGKLPWKLVLKISRPVLEGLAAAHEQGIIHRDIKPANIFLVRRPKDGARVRVLDLGLARDLAEENRLTRTGQVVGTANYLPPETLLDMQPKGGAKSGDVFAVGMVMFVMLTGHFPFGTTEKLASPAAEVIARAKFYKSGAALPGPMEFEDTVPQALDEVVRRALAIDPSQRYADARSMLDELNARMKKSRAPSESLNPLRFADTFRDLEVTLVNSELLAIGPESDSHQDILQELERLHSSPPAFELSPPPPAPRETPTEPRPRPRSPDDERERRLTWQGDGRESWVRTSRIGLSLVGAGVGILVGAVILGSIVIWHLVSRSEATSIATPTLTDAQPDVRAQVEVELRNVPANASISLDGRPLRGHILRGEPGKMAVLEVDGPDHESLRLEVDFEDGTQVDLSKLLVRRSGGDDGGGLDGDGALPGAEAPD